MEINFVLNENLKMESSIPEVVQYTFYDLNIELPYNSDYVVSLNIIRPDGYKTSEMFLMYSGPSATSGNSRWIGKLTPYYTAPITGTENSGNLLLTVMVKQIVEEELVLSLSSPIVRIPVIRAIEPDEDSIPYSVQADLISRIENVEEANTNHNNLTPQSRFLPNQHLIDSIVGLKPKIEVHIDEDEPIEHIDTWFETSGDSYGPVDEGRWQTLASTPSIFEGNVISTLNFEDEPIKLVIVGNIAGSAYNQELHTAIGGTIEGEVIINVSSDYSETSSVRLKLTPLSSTSYLVDEFENTGNVNIFSFYALRIAVYR